jgi:hypothetical protein
MPWGAVVAAGIGAVSAHQQQQSAEEAAMMGATATQQQYDIADRQTQIAEEQWERFKNTFAPIEDEIARIAMEKPDYQGAEGRATADIEMAYGKTAEQRGRELGRYGMDPSMGRARSRREAEYRDKAKSEVLARNLAREQEEDKAWSRKFTASQLGRNLPAESRAGMSAASRGYGAVANRQYGLADQYGRGASRGYQAAGYWGGRAAQNWGGGSGSGTTTGMTEDFGEYVDTGYGPVVDIENV